MTDIRKVPESVAAIVAELSENDGFPFTLPQAHTCLKTLTAERDELIAALRGAHKALDVLFAHCVESVPDFLRTRDEIWAEIWAEMGAVHAALAKADAP